MIYKIEFVLKAFKDLRTLPTAIQERIIQRLEKLSENFNECDVKNINGGPNNRFRLRVGDYRIVFDKEDSIKVILVIRIGHRKDIYRRLS